MKYRNTSLKGKNNYYLVRENDSKEFAADLEELRSVKPYLADNIQGFNYYYDENNRNQAYLIYNALEEEKCLGGIVIIAPMFDNEPLKLKMYIHEEKINSEKELFQIIDEIIDLLGRCNYGSEKITIELQNSLDLNKWNSHKYQKSRFEWKKNTYICPNSYHQGITTTLEEILNVRQEVIQNELMDFDETVVADPNKFISPIDNEAITEYRNNKVPFYETFDKADFYHLYFKLTDKSVMSMSYKYNGEVKFENEMLLGDTWKFNYDGNYDLITGSFSLQDMSNKNISISSSQNNYSISDANMTITKNKESNQEKITYQTDILDNISTVTKVDINNGAVEKCYVDLSIHEDSNKEVNETYKLRWIPKEGRLSLTYHNHKEIFETDLTNILENENEELLSELMSSSKPSLEMIDKLLFQTIKIVSRTDYKFANTNLSEETSKLVGKSVRLLEKVAGDSNSKYLADSINSFLMELKQIKKNTNKVKKKIS